MANPFGRSKTFRRLRHIVDGNGLTVDNLN